jgi:hypothetical protein
MGAGVAATERLLLVAAAVAEQVDIQAMAVRVAVIPAVLPVRLAQAAVAAVVAVEPIVKVAAVASAYLGKVQTAA